MLQVKTPRQKKQQSYDRDRVEGGKYPHADRKNRPRVKALGKRQLRHVSKQALAFQPEETLQLPERTQFRWGKTSVKLREHVTWTQVSRLQREAHNIFRRGYCPATHARFKRVMQSWLEGHSEQSSALAAFYAGVLNRFPDELEAGEMRLRDRRDFLEKFFSKEPALKRDLETWIDAVRPPV